MSHRMHSIVDCPSLSSEWAMRVPLAVEGLTPSLVQIGHVADRRPLEAARRGLQATEGTC